MRRGILQLKICVDASAATKEKTESFKKAICTNLWVNNIKIIIILIILKLFHNKNLDNPNLDVSTTLSVQKEPIPNKLFKNLCLDYITTSLK